MQGQPRFWALWLKSAKLAGKTQRRPGLSASIARKNTVATVRSREKWKTCFKLLVIVWSGKEMESF